MTKTINRDEELEIKYDGDPFTMIPRELLLDSRINPKTRLLYGIIKSYITIENFTIYKTTLRKALGCNSISAFDKYWKELKDLGLLVQEKKHINGRWKYSYKLLAAVSKKGPDETQQDSNEQEPKIQGTEKQGLVKQDDRKIDDFNNTNSSNIDLNNIILNLDSKDGQSKIDEMLSALTAKQYQDLNRLIVDVGTNKLKSTKEDLLKYVYKLYKRGFVDSKGRPINSLYGIVHSNFRIKSEKDKEEYETIKKLADDGNPGAIAVLHKYYK